MSNCKQCQDNNSPCGCPPDYDILPLICTSGGCDESYSADCVFLPEIPCLGIPKGTSLSNALTFFCSEGFIAGVLKRIGLSKNLSTQFCQLVQSCPGGSPRTTPLIGQITITI